MSHAERDGQSRPVQNQFNQALRQEWSEQMENDTDEVDLELLAAYAEGRLSTNEREVVEELVANSPAALETLLFFHRALNVGQGNELKSDDTDIDTTRHLKSSGAADLSPETINRPQPSKRYSLSRSARSLNVISAAALLIAAGAGILAYNANQSLRRLHNENQNLLASLNQQSMALALARKEQAFGTSAGTFRSFASGAVTPRMLEIALLDFGPVSRGGDPSDEEIRFRKRTADAATEAINQVASGAELDHLIEKASVAIATGDREAAALAIGMVEEEYGEESAVLKNLQALQLLARVDDGEATFEQAANALRQLTEQHPDFAQGWLNLAILTQRVQGTEASLSVWQEYLDRESYEDLKNTAIALVPGLRDWMRNETGSRKVD